MPPQRTTEQGFSLFHGYRLILLYLTIYVTSRYLKFLNSVTAYLTCSMQQNKILIIFLPHRTNIFLTHLPLISQNCSPTFILNFELPFIHAGYGGYFFEPSLGWGLYIGPR